MKIRFEPIGDLISAMEAETAAGERAVKAAMGQASTGLKEEWRGRIVSAGLGTRLSKAIQSRVYPVGEPSLNATGFVWVKPNAPRILESLQYGGLIRSGRGLYLAIPTEAAGRGGFRAHDARGKFVSFTPAQWERKTGRKLRFVFRPNKPALLVADDSRLDKRGRAVASRSKTGRGAMTVPIFILVRQVQMPKKVELDSAIGQWAGRVPDLIVQNWKDSR